VSEPLVAARGLSKRFGPTQALAGVDLAVPAGAVLAVLGPNGAGKTTLLRLVAGLARPSAGRLAVAGERAGRPAARARVGLVGHQTFLYPELTARENLLFAARLHRVPRALGRAADLLREEGLAALADRPAGTLSRGTAQRLAIARALVHDPLALLLDEPFTGLDAASADRLAARIAAARDAGRAVLLSTHDVARASALADTALVLSRGRAAWTAPPGALALPELETACRRAVEAAA